ncbi:MAG: PQQ-dependent sugar dehydrogenase [Bacteroidales bacterium]|nr:PQQ-dependent sugar dehydrogenase [Bacteroidales bacterium]
MKNSLILFTTLCFFFLLKASPVSSQVMVGNTQLDTTTIITGLDIPWEIRYGIDGWLWVTERYGRVSRIHPETGEQIVVLDHTSTVSQQGESGMLGMALHPDFPADNRVYIVYTYSDNGIKERLSSFHYNGENLTNETVLIEGIAGNSTHDGSRLLFMPDGKLMMTTGDAQNQSLPQNPGSLSGKVLRINADGTIPADNPTAESYVYSLGHRNAQGLALSADGTILYSSEHGPDTDDEINIIEANRNYGWPDVKGFCDTPEEQQFCEEHNVKEPLINWTPTIAPSDIVVYASNAIPEWQGKILLTLLKNKRLLALTLSPDGQSITHQQEYFTNWWGRLRDIAVGPQGEIYLATNGQSWSNTQPFTHSIIKLTPQNSSSGQNLRATQKPFSLRSISGNLWLDAETSLMDSSWHIYDMAGRAVDSDTITARSMKIPFNSVPGIYFFNVNNTNSGGGAVKFSWRP